MRLGKGWFTMRACAKLLLVGLSMTAEVGAIICSAVISINTFLDAHTLSQRSCTRHPPKDVTCSLKTHGCLTSAYHNTAASGIIGGPNLKPRGDKQTLTSVAPLSWLYRKQLMIYYTVLQKASRSHHARLITGYRPDHMDNKWSLGVYTGGWA